MRIRVTAAACDSSRRAAIVRRQRANSRCALRARRAALAAAAAARRKRGDTRSRGSLATRRQHVAPEQQHAFGQMTLVDSDELDERVERSHL